jgi:hypothetical protein
VAYSGKLSNSAFWFEPDVLCKKTSAHTVPKTSAEKEEYRGIIKSMAKDLSNEVNFQEALANCYRVFSEKTPIEIPDLFDLLKRYSSPDWKPYVVNGKVSDFDTMVLALIQYLGFSSHHSGVCTCACGLPLSGQLPDMTATTSSYIGLQECYQRRATVDRERLLNIVKAVLRSNGRDDNSFDWNTIDLVVKNLHGLKSVCTSQIATDVKPVSGGAVAAVFEGACSEPYEDAAQASYNNVAHHRSANWYYV